MSDPMIDLAEVPGAEVEQHTAMSAAEVEAAEDEYFDAMDAVAAAESEEGDDSE